MFDSAGPAAERSRKAGVRGANNAAAPRDDRGSGGLVRRIEMSVGTILLIVVVLLLIGALPTWPHSRSWGFAPSGGLGLVLVVLLVLLLTGRL
jgi:hypothetical protein